MEDGEAVERVRIQRANAVAVCGQPALQGINGGEGASAIRTAQKQAPRCGVAGIDDGRIDRVMLQGGNADVKRSAFRRRPRDAAVFAVIDAARIGRIERAGHDAGRVVGRDGQGNDCIGRRPFGLGGYGSAASDQAEEPRRCAREAARCPDAEAQSLHCFSPCSRRLPPDIGLRHAPKGPWTAKRPLVAQRIIDNPRLSRVFGRPRCGARPARSRKAGARPSWPGRAAPSRMAAVRTRKPTAAPKPRWPTQSRAPGTGPPRIRSEGRRRARRPSPREWRSPSVPPVVRRNTCAGSS